MITFDQEELEDEIAALEAAAGNPALIECQRTADALTALAAQAPDEETNDWAFVATRRVVQVAEFICEGGRDEEIAELVTIARGERAARTIDLLETVGPMTAERLAGLDDETLTLLTQYAAPWPVRWLFEPEQDDNGKTIRPRVVNLFHGPGGWSVGIRDVLLADFDMIGVDLDPGAVATATAAGFEVIHASVTDLDPECPAFRWVTGIILSPPCQAFSPAGLRLGRYSTAIDIVIEAIRLAGAAAGFLALVDANGDDAGYAPRSGDSWDEVRAPLAQLEDPRAGLMAEVVIWPLAMIARGGCVEWVSVEQSSALPSEIEDALFYEFLQAKWRTLEAETLDAVEYGAASRRRRRFMTAYRTTAPFIGVHPATPFPTTSFAECVGWGPGRRVNTRGQRGTDAAGRPKGGNTFDADRPATCVTATAYGWKDDETGQYISQTDIARLVGFPATYPWRHVGRGKGIRTRAQQAADAVCPMVAAAVIGRVIGRAWEHQTRAYVEDLYRPAPATHEDLDDFDAWMTAA